MWSTLFGFPISALRPKSFPDLESCPPRSLFFGLARVRLPLNLVLGLPPLPFVSGVPGEWFTGPRAFSCLSWVWTPCRALTSRTGRGVSLVRSWRAFGERILIHSWQLAAGVAGLLHVTEQWLGFVAER
jgi:hypothetical protein